MDTRLWVFGFMITDRSFLVFLLLTIILCNETSMAFEATQKSTKVSSEVILTNRDSKLLHALRKEVASISAIMEDSAKTLDHLSSSVGRTLTVSKCNVLNYWWLIFSYIHGKNGACKIMRKSRQFCLWNTSIYGTRALRLQRCFFKWYM